jgi:hypothetical protein
MNRLKIISVIAAVLPLLCSGGASAYSYSDYSLPGIPNSGYSFENDVVIKYQRSDAQSYKMTAEAKRIDGIFSYGGINYTVENLTFKLRANFDADKVFDPLGSTLRINGNLTIGDITSNGRLYEADLTAFDWDEQSGALIGFNTEKTFCSEVVMSTKCTMNESVYLYDFGGGFNVDLKKFRADGIAVTTVPVPAAVWLFGSGLLGMVSVAKRKKRAA